MLWGFLEDAQGPVDDLLSGGRYARQIASLAHEYLKAELVLEQLDLLAHAGFETYAASGQPP